VFLYNTYVDREDFWTQISQMNADKIKISEICVYLRPKTSDCGEKPRAAARYTSIV
jgi:hypothetical protein